jgi:hypothetical protein
MNNSGLRSLFLLPLSLKVGDPFPELLVGDVESVDHVQHEGLDTVFDDADQASSDVEVEPLVKFAPHRAVVS